MSKFARGLDNLNLTFKAGHVMTDRKPDDIEQAIRQAKALMGQGDIDKASAVISALLSDDPKSLDGLYILAACQRYTNQPQSALHTLEKLQKHYPQYGRGYQEQGHNYRLLGKPDAAIKAFETAITHNSALTASWKALLELYQASNQPTEAQRAQTNLSALSQLAPELISVTSMINENKLYQSEQLCRTYLQNHPKDIEGMRLLARIGLQLNVLDDAEFLLESALAFNPQHKLARFEYHTILHKRQKYQQSLEQAEKLIQIEPNNVAYSVAFANANLALGKYPTAVEWYDKLIAMHPRIDTFHMMRGHALKTVGDTTEAIDEYRQAYTLRPDNGDAFWSLANLKTYRFTESEIHQMESKVDDSETPVADRYHFCFALGKAYEALGDYSQSFSFYDRGNRLKEDETRYSIDRMHREIQQQIDVFQEALIKRLQGYGHDSPAPIFIVGLPRAGSTLLEQILASHSQVDGTFELPNILAIAHKLDGRRRIDEDGRYPGILSEMSTEQCKALGEKYIDDTRVFRKSAPFFIDKMPNNFRHIGLIKTILPNAKIIDARRDPMDCCFSCFKQLFAEGQEFTYGQEQIGHYYNDYVALMNHWDQVFPGKILRVIHEDVIDDLETQVRRILDYCELPFEQVCIDFHTAKREVRTASSEQVRQPINRKGMNQWQPYEEYLAPLKSTLGATLKNYAS